MQVRPPKLLIWSFAEAVGQNSQAHRSKPPVGDCNTNRLLPDAFAPKYTSPMFGRVSLGCLNGQLGFFVSKIFYFENQMGCPDPKGAIPFRQAKNGAARKNLKTQIPLSC